MSSSEQSGGIAQWLRDQVTDPHSLTGDDVAKVIVNLHDYHGMTHGEIATVMPLPRREIQKIYHNHE